MFTRKRNIAYLLTYHPYFHIVSRVFSNFLNNCVIMVKGKCKTYIQFVYSSKAVFTVGKLKSMFRSKIRCIHNYDATLLLPYFKGAKMNLIALSAYNIHICRFMYLCLLVNRTVLRTIFRNTFSIFMDRVGEFAKKEFVKLIFNDYRNTVKTIYFSDAAPYHTAATKHITTAPLLGKVMAFNKLLDRPIIKRKFRKDDSKLVPWDRLKGFKMNFAGRYSRRQRASSIWFMEGRLAFNTIKLFLDYDYHIAPLSNSNFSVKV